MPSLKPPRIRVRSYTVYYGYGPLQGIDQYELAILEPAGWRAADIAQLKARGVKVLAYVGAMEAAPHIVEKVRLQNRDLLRTEGKPWLREEFGTYVVDPRSTLWKRHLLGQLTALSQAGWDGVFLDSLGDVEDPVVAADTGWLLSATAELVRLARSVFPDKLVVMNNGLWLLLPLVASYLDGVCWEGTLSEEELKAPWAQLTLDTLLQYANSQGLMPMLLSLVEPGATSDRQLDYLRQLARTFGFLHYAAPCDYAQGIRTVDGDIVRGR
ncbi:MAG: endo alpha-1,4 polygalactosaminidase [Sulfobacillus sp.]